MSQYGRSDGDVDLHMDVEAGLVPQSSDRLYDTALTRAQALTEALVRMQLEITGQDAPQTLAAAVNALPADAADALSGVSPEMIPELLSSVRAEVAAERLPALRTETEGPLRAFAPAYDVAAPTPPQEVQLGHVGYHHPSTTTDAILVATTAALQQTDRTSHEWVSGVRRASATDGCSVASWAQDVDARADFRESLPRRTRPGLGVRPVGAQHGLGSLHGPSTRPGLGTPRAATPTPPPPVSVSLTDPVAVGDFVRRTLAPLCQVPRPESPCGWPESARGGPEPTPSPPPQPSPPPPPEPCLTKTAPDPRPEPLPFDRSGHRADARADDLLARARAETERLRELKRAAPPAYVVAREPRVASPTRRRPPSAPPSPAPPLPYAPALPPTHAPALLPHAHAQPRAAEAAPPAPEPQLRPLLSDSAREAVLMSLRSELESVRSQLAAERETLRRIRERGTSPDRQ